jgi:hypothetical protein
VNPLPFFCLLSSSSDHSIPSDSASAGIGTTKPGLSHSGRLPLFQFLQLVTISGAEPLAYARSSLDPVQLAHTFSLLA